MKPTASLSKPACHRGQRYLNVLRLEPDLRVCEPQGRHAGLGVSVVAQSVLRLLRGRAVIAKAIGFDDQAELRPVEVDLEAVDVCPGLRGGQASPPGDGQKVTFEFRVRKREGLAVERPSQDAHPGAGCDAV